MLHVHYSDQRGLFEWNKHDELQQNIIHNYDQNNFEAMGLLNFFFEISWIRFLNKIIRFFYQQLAKLLYFEGIARIIKKWITKES